MAHSRRHRLARQLSAATGLDYQQALLRIEGHRSRTGRLPRTDAELAVLAGPAAPAPSSAAAVPPLRRVGEVAAAGPFAIRHSALVGCPHLVMAVGHWLPTGQCAHQQPPCPTCAGLGRLDDGGRTVACATDAPLPAGVPVCGGTGTWTGERT